MFQFSLVALVLGGCAAKSEIATPAVPQVEAAAAVVAEVAPTSDWKLIFPDQPDGPQMLVLSGNPAEGPLSAMVKLPAGHASPLHSHPANFFGIAVSGTITNGRIAEEAKELAPGDTWTEPAGEVHYTGCTAAADCVFVGHMDGPMGITPAEAPAETSSMKVTAAADLVFKPANPAQPDGPGISPVFGDLTTGPFSALVHFPAGFTGPKHSHTASYSGAVVSGTISHGEGENMGAGEDWKQAGGAVHVTNCASDTPCVFYVAMDGAMDMIPAE
jgi:quercetin dioxygenase-like cupin family protein